ncbi:hypothetical protein H0S58_03465 [Acinetobacter sp. TTH0-4]|uniref:hypothetical protein n=1 Tax=Acinetobacter sp. TTH0-4 TaxID=1646498 RepID=UPI0018A0BA56|nr:hypothetical protein [Acinetobacter sp. TTH0-4]QPF38579.1 hypothetical protein H0S58_03465 [Acinetobacter sp. TTH0-4]
MQSQFKQKLAFIGQKKMTRKFILLVVMIFQSVYLSAQEPLKPTWYRYYDHKGVANISSNVTPNHIRFGYEALDQNMQVIQRNRPYNSEADAKKAPQRAAQARQNAADLKLKKAYDNAQVALTKKNESLKGIKKQIIFQQDQLKQLQNDRIYFKRQEIEHLRKGQGIPAVLKSTLDNNQKNIKERKDNIEVLQSYYRNTQTKYDNIITRLKTLE